MALLTNDNFLKAISVKTEIFKIEALDNAEVELKQFTINEAEKLDELRAEIANGTKTDFDLLKLSCRFAMYNPQLPSEEELKESGIVMISALSEIFSKIPLIGLTAKEKKELENAVKKTSETKQFSEEDIEKK